MPLTKYDPISDDFIARLRAASDKLRDTIAVASGGGAAAHGDQLSDAAAKLLQDVSIDRLQAANLGLQNNMMGHDVPVPNSTDNQFPPGTFGQGLPAIDGYSGVPFSPDGPATPWDDAPVPQEGPGPAMQPHAPQIQDFTGAEVPGYGYGAIQGAMQGVNPASLEQPKVDYAEDVEYADTEDERENDKKKHKEAEERFKESLKDANAHRRLNRLPPLDKTTELIKRQIARDKAAKNRTTAEIDAKIREATYHRRRQNRQSLGGYGYTPSPDTNAISMPHGTGNNVPVYPELDAGGVRMEQSPGWPGGERPIGLGYEVAPEIRDSMRKFANRSPGDKLVSKEQYAKLAAEYRKSRDDKVDAQGNVIKEGLRSKSLAARAKKEKFRAERKDRMQGITEDMRLALEGARARQERMAGPPGTDLQGRIQGLMDIGLTAPEAIAAIGGEDARVNAERIAGGAPPDPIVDPPERRTDVDPQVNDNLRVTDPNTPEGINATEEAKKQLSKVDMQVAFINAIDVGLIGTALFNRDTFITKHQPYIDKARRLYGDELAKWLEDKLNTKIEEVEKRQAEWTRPIQQHRGM